MPALNNSWIKDVIAQLKEKGVDHKRTRQLLNLFQGEVKTGELSPSAKETFQLAPNSSNTLYVPFNGSIKEISISNDDIAVASNEYTSSRVSFGGQAASGEYRLDVTHFMRGDDSLTITQMSDPSMGHHRPTILKTEVTGEIAGETFAYDVARNVTATGVATDELKAKEKPFIDPTAEREAIRAQKLAEAPPPPEKTGFLAAIAAAIAYIASLLSFGKNKPSIAPAQAAPQSSHASTPEVTEPAPVEASKTFTVVAEPVEIAPAEPQEPEKPASKPKEATEFTADLTRLLAEQLNTDRFTILNNDVRHSGITNVVIKDRDTGAQMSIDLPEDASKTHALQMIRRVMVGLTPDQQPDPSSVLTEVTTAANGVAALLTKKLDTERFDVERDSKILFDENYPENKRADRILKAAGIEQQNTLRSLERITVTDDVSAGSVSIDIPDNANAESAMSMIMLLSKAIHHSAQAK